MKDKKLWNIKCIRQGEEGKYLEEGWEPFAVSPQNTSYTFTNTSLNRRETQHQTANFIFLRKEEND